MSKLIAQSWLGLQCRMIPDVVEAMTAFAVTADQPVQATATWPEQQPASDELMTAAGLAVSRHAPVISPKAGGEADAEQTLVVAHPLAMKGSPYGVVAVKVAAPAAQQTAVSHLLQWGAAWLELILAGDEQAVTTDSPLVSEVLAAALASTERDEAATTAATVLAQHLFCERVSIGLQHQLTLRLHAISGMAQFDARTNLVRQIEAVMDEAVTTGKTITYLPSSPDDPRSVTAHAQLSQHESGRYVCSVPLYNHGSVIGGITFECHQDNAFSPAQVVICEQIAALLGPVLALKQRDGQPLLGKIKDDLIDAPLRRLMGPQGFRWKLAASLLVLLLLFGLLPGEFRIKAPTVLEGTVQRALVAPFDSYIMAEHARAGTAVNEGDVLAELDARDLKLERQKWHSRHQEYRKQYDKALAGLEHAEARIAKTQAAQAAAQLALLDEQLARTRLLAPFDGVIIAGDLSQALGTPVERGQVLFEVAPLDEYRVILNVDEQDITYLAVGQTGQMTLSALPGRQFPLEVEKIASIYLIEGSSAFRVEARITDTKLKDALRPGLQGVGKVVIDDRSRLWIWTRRLIAWMRLQLWKWLP
ncbi:MAG: HlyD family efflux transporter periplasmic adaptor subunit [Gammaproteobacteria bacterium]|nr:HlyD family efflux transporter periplasmic adaptor subunit [Gammaproteobacteria bacterium]